MHQALPPCLSLSYSRLSVCEDLWNIKLAHAGLLTLLIVGTGGREGRDGRAEKVGKSKCQKGFMGRSHHSKSQPRRITLTLGRAVSGCEMSSGDLPVMAAHLTCLVFSKGGQEFMGDPSDVASSPKGLA